jgi:hypothetical protein
MFLGNKTLEERKEFYENLYKDLSDALNGDNKLLAGVFIEKMQRDHRTIQQNFWRFVVEIAMIYKDLPFDLRNQCAIIFCKKIAELDERHMSYV